MKKVFKTKWFLIAITLLVGITIGWLINTSSNQPTLESANQPIDKSTDQIWTCSMHPQIRQNEPGDCPLCGMDLIPVEPSEGELDPNAVAMSPTAMQLAQVQTMIVSVENIEKSIRLNGKVQADERLLFTQSSHISGRVETLTVNYTGEFVSKGQVIAYIYSPDLVTAQDELFEAEKIEETQPALFNAAKEKLKNWKLTDQQISQILTSKKTLEQFPILANVSGYVTKKMVNLGDYIKQGDALYEIADLSSVWVLFDIYESDIAWVNKGDSIEYTIESLPGKSFKSTVTFIDPVIDPKTRVAKARVEMKNRDLKVKPEMFASGTINTKVNNNASLAVPKTAVMWTGKRSLVYVMQKSAQGISFRMREVTLGPELGEGYVIEKGLEFGEAIAINGTFSIDAAAQLAGKPSMMNRQTSISETVSTSAHNHGENPDDQMANMSVPKKLSTSDEVKKALQPLFDNYFEMKVALSNDEFENAKEAGKSVNIALTKIDMNLFEAEAHKLWMQQAELLKNSTERIAHLENIDSVRENFQIISNAMIKLAESFEPNSSPIYVQHCPMADDYQGADWLSREKEILNPYFGESMLYCGSNTKTIE